MPSFTFFASRDKREIDALRSSFQCVVPAGFDGIRGEVDSKYSHLKWHCGAQTPIELHQSDGAGYAFLVGEAIAEHSDDYLNAKELFNLVTDHRDEAPLMLSRFSGFFAWIVVLDDGSTFCAGDPFGFFPVYYFKGKHSIAIATSLKALHAHPEYDSSIDPVGFCRYLLENGCSSHRTLEKSGKRLNIAESMCYAPISGAFQTIQHVEPGHKPVKTVHKLDDAIQLSIEASSKAVKRHIQRPVDACLLSGGLDSRQVLSIAHEYGQRPRCMTLGARHSYESIYARKVARHFNLPWECSGGYRETPSAVLDDELDLLSLGGGFNSIFLWWRQHEAIQNTRCLTGLFLDITYAPFLMEPEGTDSFSYDMRSLIHNYGVEPDTLVELLSSCEYTEALDQALAEVRAEWDTFSSDPYERRWQVIAHYRARSHHGGVAWKNAFYMWPVIPALDVPLTEAIRSIDGQLQIGRKLQNEVFKTMAPELAAIPFASISSKPRPLIQTAKNKYHKRFGKIERRSLRYFEKLFKPELQARSTSVDCQLESERRAMAQIETVANMFEAEKTKLTLARLYKERTLKKSITREHYSGTLLTGALSWLAKRNV